MSDLIQRMLNQGAWEAAQQEISNLLKHDASDHPIWALQAELYAQQGQMLKAIEAFEVALSLAPHSGGYHCRLADLYQGLGLSKASLEHRQAARAFLPDLQSTLDLCEALIVDGQRQQALIYIKEALTLEPDSARAYALFGQVMILFGRFDIAQDALQQSLSLEEDLNVSLLLAELLQRQQQFSLALILLLHWQEAPMQSAQRLSYLKLLGKCFYWQADFPQARRTWQEALSLGFDTELFYLLTLAGPLFFFKASEQQEWRDLFQESLALYSDWARQMPLKELHSPPLIFPLAQREQAFAAYAQHAYDLGADFIFAASDSEGLLGLAVSDLNNPEVQGAVLLWFQFAQQPERLRLFYLTPADLPASLLPWAEQSFQVPLHQERLTEFVRGFQLSCLLFFDLKAELYHLAAQRGAQCQVYSPHDGIASGLAQMDYIFRDLRWPPEPQINLEQPVAIAGLHLAQAMPVRQKSRSDWGLSRLGHLYLCLVGPEAWGVDFDAVIAEILAQDRKAFILGLCLTDSSLHTYISQRLGEQIGERGRRRIRWLDVPKQDLPDLISVVDVVIEPPGANAAWAAYQALFQGVPVLAIQGSQHAADWLTAFGLDGAMVASEDLAQRAVRIVNSDSERVMLKQHLSALGPLEQTSQTRVQTMEEKLYQLMKTDHHARN